MDQVLDPMELWFRSVGCDLVPLPNSQEEGKICHSCGSTDRKTVRLGTKIAGEMPSVCLYCVSIRVRYPSQKGTMARLGAGTFALVSPGGSTVYTSFRLPASPRYSVRPVSGQFAALMRELVLSPPEPPYLFVAFGRRNFGSTFRVNTNTDTVWVSGGGLKIANRPVEYFDRVRVADFLTRFGDLKRDFVRSLAYANLERYQGNLDTFQKLTAKEPRSGDILAALPVLGTPEFTVLASLLA